MGVASSCGSDSACKR